MTTPPAPPPAGEPHLERPPGPGALDPYAVMRPKWGRLVARIAAAVVLASFVVAALLIPGDERQKAEWGLGDRLMILGSGVGIAWLLWRFGSIKAVPSRDGVVVRNLLVTRRLTWPQIVRVQFGGGAPWASLDLDDTDILAVMAIQKADGQHGRALASRLAALIQVHSRAEEPPWSAPPPGPSSPPPSAPGR
ncbi:MAG TPA: PH domain-containing protein [Dermatophilaceae bacterium]|nr:PH domain-containing protein [Dermatophilaceae bacterium]